MLSAFPPPSPPPSPPPPQGDLSLVEKSWLRRWWGLVTLPVIVGLAGIGWLAFANDANSTRTSASKQTVASSSPVEGTGEAGQSPAAIGPTAGTCDDSTDSMIESFDTLLDRFDVDPRE